MSNFTQSLNGKSLLNTMQNRRQPLFFDDVMDSEPIILEDLSLSQAVNFTKIKNTE